MKERGIEELGLAVSGGGLLALAFPGTGDLGWLAFGALVPLFVAVDRASWRRACLLGAVAGLAVWMITIAWIPDALVRYGELPWTLACLVLLAYGAVFAWGAVAVSVSAALASVYGRQHQTSAAPSRASRRSRVDTDGARAAARDATEPASALRSVAAPGREGDHDE